MARDPRTYVNFRIAPTGLALIDKMAEEFRVSRSEVIRAAVGVGFTHVAEVEQRLREAT
jgi:precorrin isomerase